ncbi:MAG: tripartite tricarboxylate transporter TctB family protein [Deltaproteobacteria bacterium]|nr:tripartite tricarboxylate transporter TctB family protein [Deltaproteobacteria bacterium]MBW1960412.1 tripartite tricarboxylate transporter TctB family protein [Deltaproteobacteria bacterium]MBW1994985.1 tripartite tricarboxylate transporter TctB family protein [Deltaproteobacteria bacterium]MBW2153422.1 tripartite tricarboxylate transporter TctB family protein [Deltaproteobacteria bacterium]
MADKPYHPVLDILAAAGLIVLALIFYRETLYLAESPYEPLGPAAVPKMLSMLIFICALILLGRGISRHYREKWKARTSIARLKDIFSNRRQEFRTRPELALIVISLLVIYIGLLHWKLVSYRLGCIGFMLAAGMITLWYEKRAFKSLHLTILVVLTLTMAFGSHYVFTEIFVVDLP